MKFSTIRREVIGITLEDLQTDRSNCIKKMDEYLINLWNTTVRREDTVYILGDFCLQNKEYTEKILNKLRGKKHLILGNHDASLKGLERYFESVSQIKEAKFTNNQFKFINPQETFCVEMCHFPLLTWNRRNHGTCCISGHCHGSLDEFNTQSMELRVDVGIDAKLANFNFIEIEDLYKYFISLREQLNCNTFEEYTNKLIEQKNTIKG